MNIEKIDSNKIKVTVNPKEQKEYGISYETMNYSDANTRRLCERIMLRAGKEVGFRVGESRLLVEARQSVNGNVTLYLSRLPEDKSESGLREYVFAFESFDDLWDGIRIFEKYDGKVQKSTVVEMNRFFYLYFEIICTVRESEQILHRLTEYGDLSEKKAVFLSEYGSPVLTDTAIHKLLAAIRQG